MYQINIRQIYEILIFFLFSCIADKMWVWIYMFTDLTICVVDKRCYYKDEEILKTISLHTHRRKHYMLHFLQITIRQTIQCSSGKRFITIWASVNYSILFIEDRHCKIYSDFNWFYRFWSSLEIRMEKMWVVHRHQFPVSAMI